MIVDFVRHTRRWLIFAGGCHQKNQIILLLPKQEKWLERLALLDFPTTLYRSA